MNDQGRQLSWVRRHRRFIVISLSVVVLLAVYAWYRYDLKLQVQARLDAVRQAGYPAMLAELNDWYADPPEGAANAAYVFSKAFPRYNLWRFKRSEGLPLFGLERIPKRKQPLPVEMKKLIAYFIADNAGAIKLLHEGGTIEHSRYPIDFMEGNEILVSHLWHISQGSNLLTLEAILHAENGESAQAARSIISSLCLVRSVVREPLIISQLVRLGCFHASISSLEWILNRTNLTELDLANLSKAFGDAEDLEAMSRGWIGERCMGMDMFNKSLRELKSFLGQDNSPSVIRLLGYRVTGQSEKDQLAYLDIMAERIVAAQVALPRRLEANRAIDQRISNLPKERILTRRLALTLSLAVIQELKQIAALRTAQVALAIERYRTASGKLPVRLDDLSPLYLPAVPADPFDGEGKPLRYKKLAKGYIVYSIGEDATDDGGAEKNAASRKYQPGSDVTFTVER